MARPRIRTLKPENWSDRAIRSVGREARLLRDVLITLADDDGRWLHSWTAIAGHGYPGDVDVNATKIDKWSGELVAAKVIHLYSIDAERYGCFPKWHLHQSMQKYRMSDLPSPGDGIQTIRGSSKDDTKTILVSSEVDPHAHARVVGGLRSVPDTQKPQAVVARESIVSQKTSDARLNETVAILRQCERFHFDPLLAGVGNILAAHPDLDHKKAAHMAAARGADPNYRTTDAGRALDFAFADLAKRTDSGQTVKDRRGAALERLMRNGGAA